MTVDVNALPTDIDARCKERQRGLFQYWLKVPQWDAYEAAVLLEMREDPHDLGEEYSGNYVVEDHIIKLLGHFKRFGLCSYSFSREDGVIVGPERHAPSKWIECYTLFPAMVPLPADFPPAGDRKKDIHYSTPHLEVMDAAIANFFSPRGDKDAKKEEVVDWIKARMIAAGGDSSDNVASAMFTIIKPVDHDPRKRRG
jgi:hypothetical protein